MIKFSLIKYCFSYVFVGLKLVFLISLKLDISSMSCDYLSFNKNVLPSMQLLGLIYSLNG